ncbi:LamG domain-containing protein [Lentzea sp. CA-135723]|uniref:LamG domain-containing protein n=1 Tax=Lentzea sp. CA-135723 TaxID=3239950 RepID=UPI003D93C2EF
MFTCRSAAGRSGLRASRYRLVALVAVSAAVVAAVVASTGTPRPEVVPIAEAPDAVAAFAAAKLQGSRVEIGSMRDEKKSFFAEPNGTTTAEISAVTTRVRRGDGWAPVDASLERRPDGSVTPNAISADLALSGGGDKAALVRMTSKDSEFALRWSGALPEPRMDGHVATYENVLPGVDLKMAAGVDGYSQYLVVNTPEAAKNPDLARVTFGLETKNLTVSTTPEGGIVAADSAGKAVFTSPKSLMWDSKPGTPRADVGVEISAGALTLVPDQKLLTSADATFPIVIDPSLNEANLDKTGWTTVYKNDNDSRVANSTHWNGADSQAETRPWLQGTTTARAGRAYGESYLRTKSYFQFNTDFLAGKTNLSAWLNSVVVWGPDCAKNRDFHIYNSEAVGTGTSWNQQPWTGAIGNAISVPVDSDNCRSNKDISFPAGSALRPGTTTTVMLAPDDMDDVNAWRKFDPSRTKLKINYNTPPNEPEFVSTEPVIPAACKNCGGLPYLHDSSLLVRTRMTDNDGHAVKDVAVVNRGNPKTPNEAGPEDPAQIGSPLASGQTHITAIDLTDKHDKLVRWRVRANDDLDNGPEYRGTAFVVDRVAPASQPIVKSAAYQEDNTWRGGVGVAGLFYFESNGVEDVDHFRYGWDDTAQSKVDADKLGGAASVRIAPPGDGPQDLYVRSVDRGGNLSPPKVLHLYVRPGNGPLAQYSLDGDVKDTAYLGGKHGVLNGGAGYAPGAVGSALKLNGTPAPNATAPNVLRTDDSFSVSAWAYLDSKGYTRAIVSQDANSTGTGSYPGFVLWYRPENGGTWTFGMSNTGWADTDFASSNGAPPALSTWTHITGVFDAPARKMSLYVNGELAGTANRRFSDWHAEGPLRIGQTYWGGSTPTDHWPGMIDEVRLYDRALTATEVQAEVRRDGVQAGYWKFDDIEGTTARNAVQGGDMAVLSDGASLVENAAVNGGLDLNGTTGLAQTGRPAVRTDRSFSATAWVKLDKKSTGDATQVVLSQDGTTSSGFVVREQNGRWQFGMTKADGDVAWNVLAESPANSVVVGQWTHLTAIFDATTKKATLHVDGGTPVVSAAATVAPRDTTGTFVVGAGQWSGGRTGFLDGVVDEVRVYSRIVSPSEIAEIVSRDNVKTGEWKLDGDVTDTSGRGRDARLENGPDWTSGQSTMPGAKDLAVSLNGTSSHVSAPNVVDVARNYSVSAWARIDKLGGYPSVVSQDGARTSAFQVQATPDNHWAFTMFGQDVDGGGTVHDRIIGSVVQQGVWTHLAATYDASAKQMALYVNGVIVATQSHTPVPNWGAGRLQIGRGQWGGAQLDHMTGAVDDVSTYSRVLGADEVRELAGRDLSLIHQYRFDSTQNGTVPDSVGARTGTLSPGTTFAPGRVGTAAQFDGVDDSVSTTGADLRTDESFTVSTWVYLSNKDCAQDRCQLDAVSLDGAQTSKFRLGHTLHRTQEPDGVWIFEMPESDAADARVTKAAVSVIPSDLNTWVHLVGVYDKQSRTTWLYVNGDRVGDGALDTAWRASGGLQIGRGKVGGQPAEFWPGNVDDVRVYTGALDSDRVRALHDSYPALTEPATLPVADKGYWAMDEPTGVNTAADSTANARTAALTGTTSRVGGRKVGATRFDGTTSYAETATPALNTAQSFSVSARVFADRGPTGNRVLVGQDGTRNSAFQLQFRPADERFAVVVPQRTDADNSPETVLVAPERALALVWYHVTLVYDATPGEITQLRLYVNGRLSAVRTGVTIPASAGPLSMGRGKQNGAPAGLLPGVLDEVKLYGRALSDTEVALVHDDVPLVTQADWSFDDGTANDSTWRKTHATLTGGTSFVDGRKGKALRFDGTGRGTGLRAFEMADGFGVALWVKLESGTGVQTVFAQPGQRRNAVALQYRPESKRWSFNVPTRDDDQAPLVHALSAQEAVVGQWVHLAGVYDRVSGELRLYVNGQLSGTSTPVMPWRSDGNYTMGHGKDRGAFGEQFTGVIDEVRSYGGLLTEAEIRTRATIPAA